jgi:hypothetical protein
MLCSWHKPVCIPVCMYVCIYVYTHECMYACSMYIHTNVSCVCMCMCVLACMYVSKSAVHLWHKFATRAMQIGVNREASLVNGFIHKSL